MLIDKKTLGNFPPFLVCALAREGKIGLTMGQIAKRSGLPLRTICRISTALSWDNVKFEKVEAFCRGCNFDLDSTALQNEYLRRQARLKVKFAHLSPIRRKSLDQRLSAWLQSQK